MIVCPMPLVATVVLFLRRSPLEREVDTVNGDSAVAIEEALGSLLLGGKFQKAIRRCREICHATIAGGIVSTILSGVRVSKGMVKTTIC